MALTADRNYMCINPAPRIKGTAGGADTLYKGGIMAIGTDGYIAVPAASAGVVPIGLCVKQVVAAGAHAEDVDIEVGVLAVEKKSQQKTTVVPGDGGTLNVNYTNKYFQIFDDTTAYCVWVEVGSGGTDPTILAPALGVSEKVTIGTGDNAGTVGGKIAAVINAIGGAGVVFGATGTTTVTIVNVHRGANTASAAGNMTCVTVATTVSGTVKQADVGVLFYAIADDGVVLTAAKGSANVAFGLCVGLVGSNNELWIDTRKKALG